MNVIKYLEIANSKGFWPSFSRICDDTILLHMGHIDKRKGITHGVGIASFKSDTLELISQKRDTLMRGGEVSCEMCQSFKSIIPRTYGLTPKGEPMPQTIDEWKHLADLGEKAMLKDKATISTLKQRVNVLEQKLDIRTRHHEN